MVGRWFALHVEPRSMPLHARQFTPFPEEIFQPMRHVAAFLALPTLVIAGSALAGDSFSDLRYTTITNYSFIGAPANGQPNSGTGIWDGYGQFYSNGYNTPSAVYATALWYTADFMENYAYEGDLLQLYAYNKTGTPGSTATGAFLATFTLSQAVEVTKLFSDVAITLKVNGNSVSVGDVIAAGTHQIQFDVNYGLISPSGGVPSTSFIAYDLATVPAPGAAALLGLAGLAGCRRRR